MRSILLLGLAAPMSAAMVTRDLTSDCEGTVLEATVVWDDTAADPRPILLMVPNWLGLTPAAVDQARTIAAFGYVVYVADVYGGTPADTDGARAMAGALRADRPLLRRRVAHHLEQIREITGGGIPVDATRCAAIGFCFGGGAVLELARSGADLPAVVSFHGNLDTPDPRDAEQITASVLVLHGAIDPVVPPEQVAAFQAEMEAAKVDYQFVAYGGAYHSFTDPKAATPGRSVYDPKVCARAYALMRSFLAERFAAP